MNALGEKMTMNRKSKFQNFHELISDQQKPAVETDVLFQRMYGKWYAFSVVNNDCLMTEVPEEEVQKRLRSIK